MSKVKGACTPIVGCRARGGCHARKRTLATDSPLTPVGCSGTARPLQATTWRESVGFEGIAVLLQIHDDIAKILLHKMGQHESVVQFRAPSDQATLVRML